MIEFYEQIDGGQTDKTLRLLKYALEHPESTKHEISQGAEIKTTWLDEHLKALVDHGLLERNGSNPYRYTVTETGLRNLEGMERDNAMKSDKDAIKPGDKKTIKTIMGEKYLPFVEAYRGYDIYEERYKMGGDYKDDVFYVVDGGPAPYVWFGCTMDLGKLREHIDGFLDRWTRKEASK